MVCAYLRSRPELEAGIHGRIGCLCEPQILYIVGGEALSDPDGLRGPIDEISKHSLEHGKR